MAQSFPETAHNRTDKQKFSDNWDRIKWPAPEEIKIDEAKVKRTKRHNTTGMCGEYGMSTFDKEAYGENLDRIIENSKKDSHEDQASSCSTSN